VIGWVDDPDTYPIQPKPHTMEFLREVDGTKTIVWSTYERLE
jgi:hypothetical protein